MKKRVLKTFALLLAIALIAFACFLALAFFGNPISKILAQNTAEKYLEANYSDTDYKLDRVYYSFKDGKYYAHAISPSNLDGNFTLKISMLGEFISDDYSYCVTEHGNIALRLFFEYREKVNAVIESNEYPYTLSIGFGDLEFDREVGKDTVPDALTRADLVNNHPYDVCKLGATNGELVLYVDTDEVNSEKAAEILLKTREMLDDAGVLFYSVELVLQYPPYDVDESYLRPEGRVELIDFMYTDIYEDGIIERVEKCIEDTENYYNELDKQK